MLYDTTCMPFMIVICTVCILDNLPHLITEVPFENGKVVGLWYVGNTVYTVGIYNAI